MRQLSQALWRQHWHVEVFTVADEYKDDLALWSPVPVHASKPRFPRSFGFGVGMYQDVSTFNPQVCHQQGVWQYQSLISRELVKANTKIVISPRGMLDSWALRHRAWKKRLAGWLYERRNILMADCMHALAEDEARAIRSYGYRGPIVVIPNGVEQSSITRVQEIRKSREQTRERYLLFLGRLHPKKGLRELLHAWHLAKEDSESPVTQWKLLVAGWDQENFEDELRQLISNLKLEESVRLLGPAFDEKKEHLLASAHAFVLPSHSEGLPMAVLEAWSFALPVIMTDACNLPQGFLAQAGIRCHPNPISIAKSISDMCKMSDCERSDMGQRGFELVSDRFSWHRIAHDMGQVYHWLLHGGSEPHCVWVS